MIKQFTASECRCENIVTNFHLPENRIKRISNDTYWSQEEENCWPWLTKIKTLFPNNISLDLEPALNALSTCNPENVPVKNAKLFRELFDAFDWPSAEYVESTYVLPCSR